MAVDPNSEPPAKDTVNSRFVSQSTATQDTHPIGLFDLQDFRKKQAEANGEKERAASGSVTPNNEALTPNPTVSKKKRKQAGKGKMSFGDDEDEEESFSAKKSKGTSSINEDQGQIAARRRLGANTSITAPKVMTKSSQLKEAETKDRLKKEFLIMQEAVKATSFEIPFVFFDGTNNTGGYIRMKKGDYVWLFLDRSRKIGADLGVSGGERAGTRREWARVSVDDLMLVRGEVIVPHHFDFYHFIVNKSKGYDGKILFPYTSETALPQSSEPNIDLSTYDPLTAYKNSEPPSQASLEGSDEDPSYTKVVDRRWYERNKHIFPASAWEEFDATKDYSKSIRRDPGGNAYFFS